MLAFYCKQYHRKFMFQIVIFCLVFLVKLSNNMHLFEVHLYTFYLFYSFMNHPLKRINILCSVASQATKFIFFYYFNWNTSQKSQLWSHFLWCRIHIICLFLLMNFTTHHYTHTIQYFSPCAYVKLTSRCQIYHRALSLCQL